MAHPSLERLQPLGAIFPARSQPSGVAPLVALLGCLVWLTATSVVWADRVLLPHLPADLRWWNGCSPTEAGELYDAFPGSHRDVPSSYPATSSDAADYQDARGVIAGWAHKQQGMAEGLSYGSYRNHPPDSLADFLVTYDAATQRDNVAHGLVTFAAWDDPRTPEIESRRFSASTVSVREGWDFPDYVAEIDAGRPVHLGLLSSSHGGHAVLGVGYDNSGGRQNMLVLTTWGQGLREWEWPQESVTGRGYRVTAATTLQPEPGMSPRLSGYLFIRHPYVAHLIVEIGLGDPDAPQWSAVVWDRERPGARNLALTDIDLRDHLWQMHTEETQWYLKVTDAQISAAGGIRDFQIRYGFDQLVCGWEGSEVPIPDATPDPEDPWQPPTPGVTTLTIQVPPLPLRHLSWAGGSGAWLEANWLEGEQRVSPSGDEAMHIDSGQVAVTGAVHGNLAAAAVDVADGILRIDSQSQLEVLGPVTVAGEGRLAVDGLLEAEQAEVRVEGTLVGHGTILSDVTLLGVIRPGQTSSEGWAASDLPAACSPPSDLPLSAGRASVPEPTSGALLAVLAAGGVILAVLRRGWRLRTEPAILQTAS